MQRTVHDTLTHVNEPFSKVTEVYLFIIRFIQYTCGIIHSSDKSQVWSSHVSL